MSAPHVLQPGTRLVDRYRLEHTTDHTGDTTYWRAQDELLDRAVGVCLLPGGGDRAEQVLRAARAAAAVTDSRFLRVLDANETDGVVYVVSEWVAATSLADLLIDRLPSTGQARDLALEVTAALDSAHQQGLSHLCLTPEHVLRTAPGTIKIAGLSVDAAVLGRQAADAEDAALRDTRGAAAVLYAALTGRWPGPEPSRLQAAPLDGNRLCSPRQVKAGVPDDVDGLVAGTLDAGSRSRSDADPPTSPGELNRRLASLATTGKIPVVRPPADSLGDTPPPYASPFVTPYDDPAPRRGRASRVAFLLVGLVLLAGLGLIGWQLATSGIGGVGGVGNEANPGSSPSPSSSAQTRVLAIAGATGFDPEGSDREENNDRADRAIDSDRASAWNTKTYLQQFGPSGLKTGVGLLVDLGSRQAVSSVRVRVTGDPTTISVRSSDTAGTELSDFQRVGRVTSSDGVASLTFPQGRRARYVLLWITSLPQEGPQAFRAEISDVTVRG